MISLVPDLRRPLLKLPQRDPLSFVPRPEPGGEVLSQFDIIAKAHFTGRSITDGFEMYGLNYSSPTRLRRAKVN